MRKILEVIQRKPKIEEGIRKVPETINRISFNNVNFHYERELFHQFDL
jgi:ABC-type multidrug transport system fused ATPase/permease subunit